MVFFKKEKGFISLFITLGVMLIALAIPVTVKLVEQRQETRSKAMVTEDSGGGGGGGSEEVAPAQEERPQSGSDLPSGYHPENQPVQEAPQPRDEVPAPARPPDERQENQETHFPPVDQAAQEVAQQAAAQAVVDQVAEQARLNAIAGANANTGTNVDPNFGADSNSNG